MKGIQKKGNCKSDNKSEVNFLKNWVNHIYLIILSQLCKSYLLAGERNKKDFNISMLKRYFSDCPDLGQYLIEVEVWQ